MNVVDHRQWRVTWHERGGILNRLAVLFAVSVWPQVADCRALAAIPEHHIMLTGERSGSIKIFQWKAGMA